MNAFPSSTWFTASPEWGWLIVFYFFFGGLAGGSFFLAALIDLCGHREDRALARAGYYIVLPCLLVSGLLLIVDLTRPDRFWHLLLQSHGLRPMFKFWSPMSIGSWALLLFGLLATAATLGALAESGRLRWRWALRLRPPGVLGTIVAALGAAAGLYVAGYTGVLLAVTNRPLWADTPLLGMLLVVSAASLAAAFLAAASVRLRASRPAIVAIGRLETKLLVVEAVVLIALLVTLGAAIRIFASGWGVLLALAALVGVVAPLALHWRAHRWPVARSALVSGGLVLAGGFLLRTVIVFSQRGIEPWIAGH